MAKNDSDPATEAKTAEARVKAVEAKAAKAEKMQQAAEARATAAEAKAAEAEKARQEAEAKASAAAGAAKPAKAAAAQTFTARERIRCGGELYEPGAQVPIVKRTQFDQLKAVGAIEGSWKD